MLPAIFGEDADETGDGRRQMVGTHPWASSEILRTSDHLGLFSAVSTNRSWSPLLTVSSSELGAAVWDVITHMTSLAVCKK